MTNYPSHFAIDDFVTFLPNNFGLPFTDEHHSRGQVVAIRFTRAKVFYDIVDDYYGKLHENVDSSRVKTLTNTTE